jgi:hypothetical protein
MDEDRQQAAAQLARDRQLYEEAKRIASGGPGITSRAHVVLLLKALEVAQSLNKDLSIALVALLDVQRQPSMLISAPAVTGAARSGCEAYPQVQPDGSMLVRKVGMRAPVTREPRSVM